MHFSLLILTSILAATATTALPIPDNLANGIPAQQNSKCVALKNKLSMDKATYENNPTATNRQAVANDRQKIAAVCRCERGPCLFDFKLSVKLNEWVR